MPYTMLNLIMDTLPRVGRLKTRHGLGIVQAANQIQSLLYKRLIDRRSDLLIHDFSIPIPAYGHSNSLPADFVSFAEKPKAEELYTDWMGGTVISYSSSTGALSLNINAASGSDTLTLWNLATNGAPGLPSTIIGSSVTSLTVSTGAKNLTVSPGLSIQTGQYLWLLPFSLPPNLVYRYHQLSPRYLDDDTEHNDASWWDWYALYGIDWDRLSLRPRHYKVVGTTLYLRPTVTIANVILGKYFYKPLPLVPWQASAQFVNTSGTVVPFINAVGAPVTWTTDVHDYSQLPLPWNGLFDEIFQEGVVRILQKGIMIPEADPDFMLFFDNQFSPIINSRAGLIPDTRRMHWGDFM